MAEALAEYWHRRIREELGFADQDGPTPHRPVPPEVPGRTLLVGLPRLPGPRGQRQGRRAPRRRAHRHRGERGVPARPGAVDHGDHLPSSASQVLRGVGPPPVRSHRWRPRSIGAALGAARPALMAFALSAVFVVAAGPRGRGGRRRGHRPPLRSLMITQPLPGYTAAPSGPTNGPLTPAEFASQSTSPQRAEDSSTRSPPSPSSGPPSASGPTGPVPTRAPTTSPCCCSAFPASAPPRASPTVCGHRSPSSVPVRRAQYPRCPRLLGDRRLPDPGHRADRGLPGRAVRLHDRARLVELGVQSRGPHPLPGRGRELSAVRVRPPR